MNVLITGGAGFIGSHTVDALLAEGHRVRILDSLEKCVHPGGRPNYVASEAEFVVGSTLDKALLEKCLRDVDVVYHFAAHQDHRSDFSRFFETNVVGTALLYELLAWGRRERPRVVLASSQAVYGEGEYTCDKHGIFNPRGRSFEMLARGEWEIRCTHCREPASPVPHRESRCGPVGAYGLSKSASEDVALTFGARYGIPTVVLRYSIVLGARQSPFNAYSGACRLFAVGLKSNQPPLIFEDGLQTRDFTAVEDVVAANLMALDHPGMVGRAFNVGSDKAYTVLDLFESVSRALGRDLPPRRTGAFRYGDTRHSFSSIDAIRRLGWPPRRSLDESVKAYVNYLEGMAVPDNLLLEAEREMMADGTIRFIRGDRATSSAIASGVETKW